MTELFGGGNSYSFSDWDTSLGEHSPKMAVVIPKAINLFDRQSDEYADARPNYPSSLWEKIFAAVSDRDLALDVGCGSGQATLQLASLDEFTKIFAMDSSDMQIGNARKRASKAGFTNTKTLSFHVCQAEDLLSLTTENSVDLITVATAIHWFSHDQFFAAVRKVLKPRGTLAFWTYRFPELPTPALNEALSHFHSVTLREYWHDKINHIEDAYTRQDLPFEQVDRSVEEMSVVGPEVIIRFAATWSAYQTYLDTNPGKDYLPEFAEKYVW